MQKSEPLSIKVDVSPLQEHERLRQKNIFENMEKIYVNDDTITILLLNVRSLSKHACDIKSDGKLLSNKVLCFMETQLPHQYSTNDFQQYLENFSNFFLKNGNKFLSLVYVF